MTLQEIFIVNLKNFRKIRKISQMALAELCDTSGNYIGEIEMGRRIPSFDKIEKIAKALHIDSYRLFIEENNANTTEIEEPTTRDFLLQLPPNVRKEILSHLQSIFHKGIDDAFNAKNY